MRKVNIVLRLSQVVLNEGQLDWLPRNPRTWTQQDIDRTAASIEEDLPFYIKQDLRAFNRSVTLLPEQCDPDHLNI